MVRLARPFTLASKGGTTRAQLDAAAATAAELGLELAPVELQYRVFFSVGNVSFRVVDPSAAHVKAEVRCALLHLAAGAGEIEKKKRYIVIEMNPTRVTAVYCYAKSTRVSVVIRPIQPKSFSSKLVSPCPVLSRSMFFIVLVSPSA